MSQNGFKYENGLLVGKIGGLNYDVTYWLTKEEFINKCKTDTEFSEEWGLKIEERELSKEERVALIQPYGMDALIPKAREEWMKRNNIPTKLITVTYKDKTIESYE